MCQINFTAVRISNLWIIDDDPMSSFYIKRLAELGDLADIITIYEKAQGAIAYLALHKSSPNHLPDMILLDIYMPGLDGWGFLEEFKEIRDSLEKRIEIYIISSSGHTQDIDRASGFSEVSGYLQKPITKEMLTRITHNPNPNPSYAASHDAEEPGNFI